MELLEARILLSALVSMQAGNWSSPATWGGAGIPVAGDSVTIRHAVTVDTSTDVGASGPTGTAAITVSDAPTAKLTIAPGVTLTVRGDVICRTTYNETTVQWKLAMQAGSTLRFNAPAGSDYQLQIGDHGYEMSGWTIDGTAARPCTVERVGGGTARITNGGYLSGTVVASHCTFRNLGSGTLDAWAFSVGNAAVNEFRLTDCAFDGSGQVIAPLAVGDAANYALTRVRFANSTGPANLYLASGETATGTRTITGCTFDALVKFHPPGRLAITNNYFHQGYEVTAARWASFSGNLVRSTTPSEYISTGPVADNYWLKDGNMDNPHFLTLWAGASAAITGNIFDAPSANPASDAGDLIILPGGSDVRRDYSITGNIQLPISTGPWFKYAPGVLVSGGGGPNIYAAIDHNTSIGQAKNNTSNLIGPQVRVGETFPGFAGMITSLRSNLISNPANDGNGYKITIQPGVTTPDILYAANATNNAGYGLAAGRAGKGYDLPFSTGTPGANDIDGQDPRFVAPTRNLATWGASNGANGTVSGALALLKANPGLTASSLIPYVRSGVAPQNAALAGAAHDGTAIGALPVFTVNAAPVATGDSYATAKNTSLTVATPGVLANDTDGDSATLKAVLVSGPAHGTLTLNAAGSFTYTPAANYAGPDSFTYKANDGSLDSNVATVSLTVTAVNAAPVNHVPVAPQTVPKNGLITFSSSQGNQIWVSDPDAGNSPVRVTLRVAYGTLTLASFAGLTFSAGDGTDDAEMTFVGTISSINASLNGLRYSRKKGNTLADTLTIISNDLGNSGSGGALTATSTVRLSA